MRLFRLKPKKWNHSVNDSQTTEIPNVEQRVRERLNFTGVSQETLIQIRKIKEIISPHKPDLVDQFYAKITAVDLLKGIIDQHSSVERLKRTMTIYLEQFLQAEVNQDYISTRIIIGHVHSRINLTAEHFISAHHLLIQKMTAILMERLSHQPKQMIESVLAVQKLAAFDQQLIVEVYMEETFKSFLYDVSETLNYLTQLETTKELIIAMDNMIGESYNVSSSTEEVSASIAEVANNAVNVADATHKAVHSAEESKQVVHETLKGIQQVGEVYEQVDEQVKQLNQEIHRTHAVIDVIREITEQTNLLALNASIEAARAGENGKGFAIVADEVRKLAEHTKKQTIQITTNMDSLQHVSNLVTKQINNTGKLVEQSVTGAQYAHDALNNIVATMEEINQNTTQIAAMTEEQSSAVDEIAQRNSIINELSNQSQEISKQTAQLILDLSKQLESYRHTFFATNIKLNYKDIIKVAKTDHLLWKWKIYNMLLGLEKINSKDISSPENCRLGQWYYGDIPVHIKNEPSFKQIEEPHRAIHLYAKEAVEYYATGNVEQAQHSFEQLHEASEIVLHLLSQLESVI